MCGDVQRQAATGAPRNAGASNQQKTGSRCRGFTSTLVEHRIDRRFRPRFDGEPSPEICFTVYRARETSILTLIYLMTFHLKNTSVFIFFPMDPCCLQSPSPPLRMVLTCVPLIGRLASTRACSPRSRGTTTPDQETTSVSIRAVDLGVSGSFHSMFSGSEQGWLYTIQAAWLARSTSRGTPVPRPAKP